MTRGEGGSKDRVEWRGQERDVLPNIFSLHFRNSL
jgi:hypothetical protein